MLARQASALFLTQIHADLTQITADFLAQVGNSNAYKARSARKNLRKSTD
jgi:hypothetical protein